MKDNNNLDINRPENDEEKVEYRSKRNRFKFILIAVLFIIALLLAFFKFSEISFMKNTAEIEKIAEMEKTSKSKQLKKTVKAADEKKEIQRVSFMGVGDNLRHDNVFRDAKQADGSYDFKPMYEDVKDLIGGKDLAYIDQESIIAGDHMGLSGYPSFNTPKDMAQNVKDLGFDIINIANNHTLDRGAQGITNTCGIWKEKELIADGAFATEETARKYL